MTTLKNNKWNNNKKLHKFKVENRDFGGLRQTKEENKRNTSGKISINMDILGEDGLRHKCSITRYVNHRLKYSKFLD